ncbi:hypothetical protein ES705_38701 [subsurface metagenome]
MKIKLITLKEIEEEEEKGRLITIGHEEYFSVKDIMKWIPWSATTIKKYIRSGKIRGRKISEKWFVSREDLYRYLGGK